MKNQIMEYDRYVGMNRKYGSVRIQTLKHLPVTVSFILIQFDSFVIFSLNSLKKNKRKINFNGTSSLTVELSQTPLIVKTLKSS